MKYYIPINEATDFGTVTMDIVEITGGPRARLKKFRKYLEIRYKITQFEEQMELVKALGFEDLLKRR